MTCRELPDFTIVVAPGHGVFDRIEAKLRHHLVCRYGIVAEVAHETNVVQFRCSVAA